MSKPDTTPRGAAAPASAAPAAAVKLPLLRRLRLVAAAVAAWVMARRVQITLVLLIAAFALAALWRDVVVSHRPGEYGVYWSRFFGGTYDTVLGEGAHFKLPWDEITIYTGRVQETSGSTVMLTRDGMEITVDWSARYAIDPKRLARLHREVGPEYAKKIVIPEVISSLRKVLGNYTAEQIYAADEAALIAEIDTSVRQHVQRFHPLTLESVLLLRLDLPDQMAQGIINKMLHEQTLLSFRYRLQNEQEEAKRKETEALGIKKFETISGISMLRWRGIDATQELAKSPNAKVIIMGTGQNGLPLLLNTDTATPAAAAASAAPSKAHTPAPPPGQTLAPAPARGRAAGER